MIIAAHQTHRHVRRRTIVEITVHRAAHRLTTVEAAVRVRVHHIAVVAVVVAHLQAEVVVAEAAVHRAEDNLTNIRSIFY